MLGDKPYAKGKVNGRKQKNQGLKAKLALQSIQMCEEQQGEHEEPKFHHEEEWMDGSTVLDYAV